MCNLLEFVVPQPHGDRRPKMDEQGADRCHQRQIAQQNSQIRMKNVKLSQQGKQ